MDKKDLLLKICGVAAFGLFSLQVSAATLTLGLDYEFSGADAPAGPGPDWMTATFDDTGLGEVTLTISNVGLVDAEFVSGFYFNVGNGIDATGLAFNHVSGDSYMALHTDNPATNSGTLKADGDGYFDIRFQYDTSAGSTFGFGEESVYKITGTGLDALDFAFLSAPGGGTGSWAAAAHVQGIGAGAGGSGWIGAPVPVPAAAWLFGSGLIGLVGVARRKNRV